MKRLWWTLSRHRSSWPLALALALLALTALLHGLALPALQARLAQAAVRATAPGAAGTQAAQDGAAAQLAVFRRHFATGQTLPDHLAQLQGVAQTHGIALTQGEYRLVVGREALLREYQVLLPVQGPYSHLREFMAAALDTLPVAALDEVSFERGRIGEPQVNARLRLTLFHPAP